LHRGLAAAADGAGAPALVAGDVGGAAAGGALALVAGDVGGAAAGGMLVVVSFLQPAVDSSRAAATRIQTFMPLPRRLMPGKRSARRVAFLSLLHIPEDAWKQQLPV